MKVNAIWCSAYSRSNFAIAYLWGGRGEGITIQDIMGCLKRAKTIAACSACTLSLSRKDKVQAAFFYTPA